MLICQSPASHKRSSAQSGCREGGWNEGAHRRNTVGGAMGKSRRGSSSVAALGAARPGVLPASTRIAHSSRGAPVRQKVHEAAEVVPHETQRCRTARPRRPRERALQARFGCLQIQRYIPLTGVPAGQKAEATGQYRGSTSHGVAGGEVRTMRPLPAHLEGDKRSTGGGLEVLVQWRNNVSSLAPAREGFASGAGEAVDGGRPKDLRRELQG